MNKVDNIDSSTMRRVEVIVVSVHVIQGIGRPRQRRQASSRHLKRYIHTVEAVFDIAEIVSIINL